MFAFPQNQGYVPSIRVAGKWLVEMGFACGDRVRLTAKNGKITIHKKVAACRIILFNFTLSGLVASCCGQSLVIDVALVTILPVIASEVTLQASVTQPAHFGPLFNYMS